MQCDLLLRAPRALLAEGQFHSDVEIAIRDGVIAAVGSQLDWSASQTVSLSGESVVLPGLIDLHMHPARSGSVFGLNPDKMALPYGTTTVVSQGDAGSDNIDQFHRDTVQRCRTRVLLAINLSRVGESTEQGCFSDPKWLDPDACRAALEREPEMGGAVAGHGSRAAGGDQDPRPILAAGLQVASSSGLPLMYGMRPDEEWPFADQLEQLRPNDLVTYCFRRQPHCIVAAGQLHPAILAARRRGVLFDIGHGRGSFDFEVARQALANKFPPDTISTDLQRGHEDQSPPHSLLSVVSKLVAVGMDRRLALRSVSERPAAWLDRDDVAGTIQAGRVADLAVLHWSEQPSALTDTSGQLLEAAVLTVEQTWRAGQLVEPLGNVR